MFLINKLSTKQHIAATVAAVVTLGIANTIINALYEASKFPVPFAEGQTSFNGDQIKAWYAVMSTEGTLDIYIDTQLFDFVFMAAMASFGLLGGSLTVRLANGEGTLRKITRWFGHFARLALPIGAGFDAIENLFSFIMLAQPETFANFWATLQSSAAVAKFALQVPGIVVLSFSLAALAIAGLTNLAQRSSHLVTQS